MCVYIYLYTHIYIHTHTAIFLKQYFDNVYYDSMSNILSGSISYNYYNVFSIILELWNVDSGLHRAILGII